MYTNNIIGGWRDINKSTSLPAYDFQSIQNIIVNKVN